MKIKFADKTVEVEDIFFGETDMTEDALNTYGFFLDDLASWDSDSPEAADVFEVLRVRGIAFSKIDEFAAETGMHRRDAFDIAYRGYNDREYQEHDHEIADELDLIEANFRRWRAASEFGRMGGSAKSAAKTAAVRRNARLPRPRIKYNVFEDNGGGLTLIVSERGVPIYAHSGYEYNPGQLSEDLDALDAGANPVKDGWDNPEGDPVALEKEMLDDPINYKIVATTGRKLFPDRMGAAASLEFGVE